jgi:hypothetical protein
LPENPPLLITLEVLPQASGLVIRAEPHLHGTTLAQAKGLLRHACSCERLTPSPSTGPVFDWADEQWKFTEHYLPIGRFGRTPRGCWNSSKG